MPPIKPKTGKVPNPILRRVVKIEGRLDGHDRELADIHAELAHHNADIITLADVLYRARRRDRLKLARRLRAAKARVR